MWRLKIYPTARGKNGIECQTIIGKGGGRFDRDRMSSRHSDVDCETGGGGGVATCASLAVVAMVTFASAACFARLRFLLRQASNAAHLGFQYTRNRSSPYDHATFSRTPCFTSSNNRRWPNMYWYRCHLIPHLRKSDIRPCTVMRVSRSIDAINHPKEVAKTARQASLPKILQPKIPDHDFLTRVSCQGFLDQGFLSRVSAKLTRLVPD